MKRDILLGELAEIATTQTQSDDVQLDEVYSPVAIILTDSDMMDGEIIREMASIVEVDDALLSAFLSISADIVEEFPLDRIEAIERIEELDNYDSVKLEEIAELYAGLQKELDEDEDIDDLSEDDNDDDSSDDEDSDYDEEYEDEESEEDEYDEGYDEDLDAKEEYMNMKRRADSFNALGLIADEEEFG